MCYALVNGKTSREFHAIFDRDMDAHMLSSCLAAQVCKKKRRAQQHISDYIEDLQNFGYTVLLPDHADAAPTAGTGDQSTARHPRVAAGIDGSNSIEYRTRLSQVPTDEERPDLIAIGNSLCAATQYQQLADMCCQHAALCRGASIRIEHKISHGVPQRFTLHCTKCDTTLSQDWVTLPQQIKVKKNDKQSNIYLANLHLAQGCLAAGMGYEDVRKLHAWQETRIPKPTTFANQMHYWGCRTVELAEISMRDVRRDHLWDHP